MRKRILE